VRLSNLQHRFDTEVHKQIRRDVSDLSPLTASVDQICSALDERTVLIDYYCGVSTDGTLAVHLLTYTQEGILIGRVSHSLAAGMLVADWKSQQIVFNALTPAVRRFRVGIQAEPGFAVVDEETSEALADWIDGFFGSSINVLKQMRDKGKNHLCIVPHGPLHYFPFHLLGPREQPLASDWVITYLPSLSLLFRKSRSRRRGMTAIGKSFLTENPRGLAEIPEAADEAKDIAAIFDVPAVTEERATKTAVLTALGQSRYVHISTHGEQNEVAPAFHCLYLTPDSSGDDKLYAYEIDGLNLSGIEVVTLSACQTALGRFDPGDNLRGLPASLLLAGVSTLIGTLWDAEAKACQIFFTTFYQKLQEGATKLDAFFTAQQDTRMTYPSYRAWGPFYFVGDWR